MPFLTSHFDLQTLYELLAPTEAPFNKMALHELIWWVQIIFA